MSGYVNIESLLPQSLRVEGIKYNETKDLSMKEVSVLIERDLQCLMKRVSFLDPVLTLRLIKHLGEFELRIQVGIAHGNATQAIQKKIEEILWSYNFQLLLQRRGWLIPQRPRFDYAIKIGEHAHLSEPKAPVVGSIP